jgi:hypothetical protein
MRTLGWFIVGAVGAILFWGALAPKPQHTPANDQIAKANQLQICGWNGPAVKVVQTLTLADGDMYAVTCAQTPLATIPASW